MLALDATPASLEPKGHAMDPATRATGTVVALIATLLSRAGITPKEDFAYLLGVLSINCDEGDPEQSEILAAWGSIVQSLTPDQMPEN